MPLTSHHLHCQNNTNARTALADCCTNYSTIHQCWRTTNKQFISVVVSSRCANVRAQTKCLERWDLCVPCDKTVGPLETMANSLREKKYMLGR